MQYMKKIAVAIYGPPGAGKGTQADLLCSKRGSIHFDTGKRLRAIFTDPANRKNKRIEKERINNEKGFLNTPAWVLSIVKEGVIQTSKAGLSIVFSGSPRTIYEAFGDKKTKGLTSELVKQYGKKNIFFIFLSVRPEVAKKRNTIRLVCVECKTSVSGEVKVKECPICLGKMQRRKDDAPEVYSQRIQQYNDRTLPIIAGLKKNKFTIINIDGEQKPYKVFADIERELDRRTK